MITNAPAAADFVGRFYFRQDPRLLKWALTNPLDRVQYQPLTPLRKDFELIVRLMRETGGRAVNVDTSQGALDVTFFRLATSDAAVLVAVTSSEAKAGLVGERHGFARRENEMQGYRAILAFLEEHLR